MLNAKANACGDRVLALMLVPVDFLYFPLISPKTSTFIPLFSITSLIMASRLPRITRPVPFRIPILKSLSTSRKMTTKFELPPHGALVPSPVAGDLPVPTMWVKEPLVYVKRRELSIYSHEAPSPQNREFRFNSLPKEVRERYLGERRRLSPLKRILKNPPLPGGTIGPNALQIKIGDQMQASDRKLGQIFTVEVQGRLSRLPILAKFYDPVLDEQFDNID